MHTRLAANVTRLTNQLRSSARHRQNQEQSGIRPTFLKSSVATRLMNDAFHLIRLREPRQRPGRVQSRESIHFESWIPAPYRASINEVSYRSAHQSHLRTDT